jgi:hypothetical protein
MFELTEDEMDMCERIVHKAVHTAVSRLLAEKRGEEWEIDKEVRFFMSQAVEKSPW